MRLWKLKPWPRHQPKSASGKPGAGHIFTRPHTPKTNGRAERFIQTLLREWAYGLVHPSAQARNTDLPRWLDWFNTSRPHSALNGLSPVKRVNNLMRTHS
ncbi:integrase core domain-containing protein [Rhodobacter capsulatus]|jgi:transposase InsO family protein|uniref:integrase core domain-containing protein n=1 Tax=Rhodobacter capsulatus TaxID=1061 RepID=UPI0009B5C158|nr:integrase core domain-containing protein [Rhodobacter capsulatus]MDS0926746.1 integrase core domain-containing protein [Rhodobacter capsulatus]TQD37398.1 transposase [Rhodobacter capsulatus]